MVFSLKRLRIARANSVIPWSNPGFHWDKQNHLQDLPIEASLNFYIQRWRSWIVGHGTVA
jgi:hypothetical protein